MSSYTINLLPKKKEKAADKLLHFILYYFRYIIVITQIVVIGVFFFRFHEDQKIIDLKQKFRQKQQILAVTSPIVDEAEVINSKAGYVRVVLDNQEAFLKKMTIILASIPEDISLDGLDMDDELIELRGTATNVEAIKSLQRKLGQTPGFESTQIGVITNEDEARYEFTINIPTKAKNERRTAENDTE